MYSLTVDQLRPGMVLATDILDADGRALLRAGTELSSSYIRSLRARGFLSAHIEDGLADVDDRPADVENTVRRLGEEPLTLDGPTAGSVAALFDVVEQLLSQVLMRRRKRAWSRSRPTTTTPTSTPWTSRRSAP